MFFHENDLNFIDCMDKIEIYFYIISSMSNLLLKKLPHVMPFADLWDRLVRFQFQKQAQKTLFSMTIEGTA